MIVAGLTHFSAARAFDFPPGAFTLSPSFFTGLGAAMLIATYDYWGYYNVCFLGGEVKDPGRTIPRALILSIFAVAAIYIVMNICRARRDAVARIGCAFGRPEQLRHLRLHAADLRHWAGRSLPALIMWTAFASVFSLLLGYSRVPYAAALDGNYFRAFARVHPEHRFPTVSLLALGGVAMLFCLLRLADVIAALVVIRILLQFIVQAVGVMVLRMRRPDMPRPFRMWLYPVAGAAGDCRLPLHSDLAQEFPARDSLRRRHPDRRPDHLPRAFLAASRDGRSLSARQILQVVSR